MSSRGMHYNVGESHSQAKLTDDQVRAIRREYEAGQGRPFHERVTHKQLGAKYGVSISLVQRIVKKEIWRHVL